MFKLNSEVTDKATGIKGIVTLLHIEMDLTEMYLFQPAAVNPKTKIPLEGIWASPARLEGKDVVPRPELPTDVLGTIVEDITGFKGMAVSLVLHATGCVHFNVQPQGKNDDGEAIKPQNFSIQRLKGPAIKKLSAKQAEQERKSKPSPNAYAPPKKLA